MQSITLRVIAGADRGKVFRDLTSPITLGREEGNLVQLNDERISRYHVKIQEEDGRLVVTDLDSTNGTKVNGNACNLKILKYGDTISIGRTVLLVGSKHQVAKWFEQVGSSSGNVESGDPAYDDDSYDFDVESTGLAPQKPSHLSHGDISLPRGLTTFQSAELRELLDQVHRGVGITMDGATVNDKDNTVVIDQRSWQSLLMIQSAIAELIRTIEDPQSGESLGSDTGRD